MYYADNIIEDIRNGNDIVEIIGSYISLQQRGGKYFGLCPFHREHTPSFSVSPDEQLYYCFGCNASGNVYSFIMQMENYDFVDAVKFLADRINYVLPEKGNSAEAAKNAEINNVIYEIHKKAARFFYYNLGTSEGEKALRYLDSRKISESIRKKYGLGYALYNRNSLSDYLIKEGYDKEILLKSGLVFLNKKGGCYDKFFGRIMFPIIDVQGRIIAFGGRIIGEGEPKYLNSPDTPIFKKSRNLYSINFARKSGAKEFILVEGYMDVISLYQAGFHNAAAALGTAFNDDHARALKKYAKSVILLFDSDEAGTKAALKAGPVLMRNGIRVKVLQVKDAKDPDEFIKKFGKTAFSELLYGAKSYTLFQIECERKKYNFELSEDKIMFMSKAAEILSEIDNDIERDVYAAEMAETAGVSKEAVINQISKILNNNSGGNGRIKYNKPKAKANADAKGVDDGRKNLIKIMASDYNAYKKIREVLSPEEFINPTYVKLINIIDDFYKRGQSLYSAEIINYFDSVEEQSVVSNIFITQKNPKDVKVLEKAVNDEVRAIKTNYLKEVLIPTSQDIETIQKFITEKKSIDNLNIRFSDG